VQGWLFGGIGAAILVAVLAGVADRRREHRDALDDVGWVPWRGLQVAAIGALLVLLILSLQAR
jgi:hypothetical protein